MKKKFYLNILLILILIFILGCAGTSSFTKKDDVDKTAEDLFEFKEDLGDLVIKLIVSPGEKRISVLMPVSVAFWMENNGKEDIRGTYTVVDTSTDPGGLQRDEMSGSFIAETEQIEQEKFIDSVILNGYSANRPHTQFILNVEFEDKAQFIGSTCIKESIYETLDIENCDARSKENGEASNSAVKITGVDKFLNDNSFDRSLDEVAYKIGLDVDNDCELVDGSLRIDTFDAAGITGFDCKFGEDESGQKKEDNIYCSVPTVLGSGDFFEGQLNIVLDYKCKVVISSGIIKLHGSDRSL